MLPTAGFWFSENKIFGFYLSVEETYIVTYYECSNSNGGGADSPNKHVGL